MFFPRLIFHPFDDLERKIHDVVVKDERGKISFE